MTKEEALNKFIERYKSYMNKRFVNLVDCCGMDCEICPFKGDQCADDVVMAIIDHFVKAEERSETNLEHYASKSLTEKYGFSPFMSCDTDTLAIALKDGWEKTFNWSDPIQWLLSPYEPPKYKLTQLEHDLLDYCCYKQYDDTLKDWTVLMDMQNKGHYKGIPKEIKIMDILDNAEVIDE